MDIDRGRIINDFIELNKRQYIIPVYQRNYEWTKEQCEKLFADIVEVSRKDATHFCGSIVYSFLMSKYPIDHYIIIDGQQRLTTIYLLLKAMLDSKPSEIEKEGIVKWLFNNDKFDEYGIDKASKLKLKPIKSDNQQLALLMENKVEEIDKGSGIWKNYQLFCELIQRYLDNGGSISDIRRGLDKLVCAQIRLNKNDNAQEIFERINSTGVPLSLADKIRNFVLMTDVDQEKLYENYWLKVENLVKKDMMSSFFTDYLNMKIDGFAREGEAYDIFKKVYQSGDYTNETMLAEILHYAEFYNAFLYGNSKVYGEEVTRILLDLQKLKQSTVFLFLFRVFDDYHKNIIDQKELAKVLNLLLNYSIRRLICEVGSNSLRGLYKTLYARVFANEKNKDNYYDAIVSFLMQMTSKDVMPSDETFVLALKQNNLYRKNALCKYLLTEIENQGKERIVVENLSIEHIMPQNSNLSTEWQVMLGSDWSVVKDKYLHTLGNLTLTGYNSELGDKPFAEKKKKLAEAQTKIVTLNSDVWSCDAWNENTITERADRLANTILQLHSLELPVKLTSFSDPRYKEYTCDDPEEAKFKTPNYFVLQGERVTCDNFNTMLKDVIDRLYLFESSIIEDMCANKKKFTSSFAAPFFSYDASSLKNPDQVANSGIYHPTGFSAPYCIGIIQLLLDRYEIDRSEFVYSAKSYKTIADNDKSKNCNADIAEPKSIDKMNDHEAEWKSKKGDLIIEIEKVFNDLKDVVGLDYLTYQKQYLGVNINGVNKTVLKFRPKADCFFLEVYDKSKTGDRLKGLQEKGLSIVYLDDPKDPPKMYYYRITLNNYEDYLTYSNSIKSLVEDCYYYEE